MCSKVKFCFLEISAAFFLPPPKKFSICNWLNLWVRNPWIGRAACITFANVSSAKAGHMAKRRGRKCQSSDCAMGGLPGWAYSVIKKLN